MLRSGLFATLGCNERCALRLDVVVDHGTQRRYGLSSRRIGRRTFTATAGRRPLRIQLTPHVKQRLRRARSVGVTVRVAWSGVQPVIRRSGTVRLR